MENRNNFIKKLIYRSKYTGTRETDILLGDFADNFINNLNDDELLAYQKLLDSGDPRIWRLSIDIETTNSQKEMLIVQMIKKYKGF
ncbi:succinate dehydrogenase assembly factor 2 [Pseudomonadota bacterium]|nr:succinate dehydrogenase assembly factor 2 [Alphaproteobacteria bacterium]MDC1357215.1 succinate dehydrogenase assembly factor 2 [Pseudomonadota bacterium]